MPISQQERSRRYYEKNKDKIKARAAEWRAKNPEKNAELKRAWYAKNKKRESAKQRAYRLAHPERKVKDKYKHLRTEFGLTKEQHDAMSATQDNKCAICRIDFATLPRVCVDHDHVSGAIRGILCSNCNSAIAMAKDNPTTLRAAADYVEQRTPRSS